MHLQDVLELINIVIVGFGLSFGFYQWAHSNKIKRAEYLNKIIERLRFDESLSKIMYLIEYGNCEYGENFHGGNGEKEIDRFLSYINYICFLRNNKIIHINEFRVLEYEVNRICSNQEVQAYLWNLHHFAKKNNSKSAFDEIIKYGVKEKLLIDGFYNNNTDLFAKRLNF